VTGPGYTTLDFSLIKDTRIFEHLNMQFRAEIFNILNQVNFGIPALGAFTAPGSGSAALVASPVGLTGNAANAGQITSIIGTARQIQFGLKFIF